ncbi:trypsin inhibitor ClTI-1-like [Peromyscus eremicus]|uniref:trypsin inhibitor ClTI-1-like n=1 Tax=Peromyscus eremicus TaxID=42410 RepID=UPI0027DBA24C|nr:trypsin inhibitor ClTI-1-like [Peromyscus eremicus]
MLVFSRVMYITLSFLLFSESFFIISAFTWSHLLCRKYNIGDPCPRTLRPVCSSTGRTYPSKCIFCKAFKASNGRIKFKRNGIC